MRLPSLPAVILATSLAGIGVGCAKKAPPPPPPSKPAPPPPPKGPTMTDFNQISKKLMKRCVGGGWISRWRSEHEDVDVAKPKIFLQKFDDKTGQDLDPSYLHSVLERRMRMSGVYEMVSSADEADFVADGRLMRLAERGRAGRISVYTAILELKPPTGGKMAYSCEATVRGEM